MGRGYHYDYNDRDDGTIEHCPYCGGEGIVKIYTPSFLTSRFYYVTCEDCGVMTQPTATGIQEAIERWNRRV